MQLRCSIVASLGGNMMSKDEQRVVSQVYARFHDLDSKTTNRWTRIDELMCLLQDLSNEQIIIESAVQCQTHKTKGQPRCKTDHPIDQCFVPTVIEGVEAILKLYTENTDNLHPKNRFILSYYLVLSHLGYIISK